MQSNSSGPGLALAEHPEVMTLQEVARVLRFSAANIRMMAAAGKIPGRKIGNTWRFLRADIEDLLGAPSLNCAGASSQAPQ